MKVKLKDLAHAMALSDRQQSYVDIKKGAVVIVDELSEEETLSHIFEIEDDWENYIPVPNIIDEGKIDTMKDFASKLPLAARERLEKCLIGAGGETRFMREVQHLLLKNSWDKFFFTHLENVARDWCEENALDYDV